MAGRQGVDQPAGPDRRIPTPPAPRRRRTTGSLAVAGGEGWGRRAQHDAVAGIAGRCLRAASTAAGGAVGDDAEQRRRARRYRAPSRPRRSRARCEVRQSLSVVRTSRPMGRIAGPDGDEKDGTTKPRGGTRRQEDGRQADRRTDTFRSPGPAPPGLSRNNVLGPVFWLAVVPSPSAFRAGAQWHVDGVVSLHSSGAARNGRRACRRRHPNFLFGRFPRRRIGHPGTGTPRLRQSRQPGKPDVTCGRVGPPPARRRRQPRRG